MYNGEKENNTLLTTLTDHILTEQRRTKHITQGFHFLLTQIENASKIIASHVRASGLGDILGKTGKKNTFGEEVQKLDAFANQLLIDTLINCGQVHAVVSEEEKEPVFASKKIAGDYIVYFDPLDGSSNIDTNNPIGTIFAIYHKDGGILQPGKKQLAAGYVIYGSSVMFVYTVGNGVNGFTLDPAIGSYILSHPDMKIPEGSNVYSINEAYFPVFKKETQTYLTNIKTNPNKSSRYVGTLVADAHRTFIKGGIFLHPATDKRPDGKLRLMLEVNPFSMLTEQAGGAVLGADNKNPLTIVPTHIHDRSPFIMGSTDAIKEYLANIK